MFKKFGRKARMVIFTTLCMAMILATNIVAFAESETANAALVAAAQTTANTISANVTAIIPIVVPLMALVMGITIGIKNFKRLTNKAT